MRMRGWMLIWLSACTGGSEDAGASRAMTESGQSAQRFVTITSSPTGALVFVDNRFVGRAPTVSVAPSGDAAEVRVIYRSTTQRATLQRAPSGNFRFHAVFEPRKRPTPPPQESVAPPPKWAEPPAMQASGRRKRQPSPAESAQVILDRKISALEFQECNGRYRACTERCSGCRSLNQVASEGSVIMQAQQRIRYVNGVMVGPKQVGGQVEYGGRGDVNHSDCCLRCAEAKSQCTRRKVR